MASTLKLSLRSGEDGSDGPRFPDPKRQRITTTRPVPPPQNPNHNRGRLISCTVHNFDSAEEEEQVDEEEEVEEEDVEEEEEEEEEEGEEEEEEEEENEDEDENENEDEDEQEDETVEVCDEGQRGKGKMVERSDSSQNARSIGDGAISVILSDPDVLSCPICLESLTIPVFQCENGHVACNCCCNKLKNKCPSCCLPIGFNRCRAIEKVIESIKIPCQNTKYGCKQTVSYTKKHDHEHECLHSPSSCPLAGCSFFGSFQKLYQHFSSKHAGSATRFTYDNVFTVALYHSGSRRHKILQEKSDDVIFILNFSHEDYGTLVNVICIGPPTNKRGCSYEVTAKRLDTSVVLKSVTENVRNWVEHRPIKAFLTVPREFDYSTERGCGWLLQVCIRRPS